MPNNLITKDIDNPIVLHIVNNELDTVTDTSFATPQAAYERVAKVLATVNIPLHVPDQFEHNGGMDVFDLTQFFSDLDGEEKLFLYFEYQLEDSGLYTVFAEVVNFDDLHDLIDNYNSEKLSLNEMIAPNKHPLIHALKNNDGGYGDEGDKIAAKLKKTPANNKKLGTGAFGSAYARKDHVIKVYDDPGYHEFAKYARDHHHEDPHLPKIHSVQRIKGTSYGVVKMERLNPIAKGMYSDRDSDKEDWMKGKNAGLITGVKEHPTMSKTIEKIRAHLNSKGIEHSLDLHSGNIMKRDDGTPVLTDPVVSYSKNPNMSVFKPGKNLKEMTVRDVSKKLHHHGFEHHRSSGGHDVWKHKSGKGKIIPIPRHKGDLPPGTARSILKAANIAETVWEYYKTK